MLIDGKHLDKINADLATAIAPFEITADFQHFGLDGSTKASKKPFWVIGKVWEYKGNAYFCIQYGDFRGGNKFQLASYDLKEQSTQFKKAHNDQMAEIERKTKALKEKNRNDGINKWKPKFYECNPQSATHEYLVKKKVDANYRARVDHRNTLLIPVEGVDEDGLLTFEGVQMIFRNAETLTIQKFFNSGLIKKGAFTRITEFDVKKSEFVYLAEGYATGASVFMATGVPTVVAFDSGNLDPVIANLKTLNADIKIIIAADDDFQTIINGKQVNVGIVKALACQKKYQNVTYKKPRFAGRNDETDFNDLMILEGVDVVREQLKINRGEFTDIILLGHLDHDEFYYLCTQSKSIVSLKASQHKGEYLKAIANEKYWAEKYGWRKDKEGNTIPNWQKISDTLLERQRDIGQFNPRKMRGLGVWEDEGRVFVNSGQGVYNAEKRNVMSNIDPHLATKNFYSANNDELVNFDDELTDDEAMQIVDAFKHLRFKNPYDYFYVTGFIAIANVFGALDWRPHLWVTGESGSGKSWVLKQIQSLIYYSFATKYSTAAGISQHLGRDAKAIVYDEAEAYLPMVEGVVDLARQCSTRKGDLILRGTVSGEAIKTEANACFCMGSIQPWKMDKADDSRFFIVDLHTITNQSPEEYKDIMKRFKSIEGMGQRLMVRMVNNYDLLIENIEVCKIKLRAKGISPREADQLSTVIAGFCLLMWRKPITDDLFNMITDKLDFKKSDYVERNEESNESECFAALMQIPLNNMGLTLAEAIKSSIEAKKTHLDMVSHGLMWSDKRAALFLAQNSATLDAKMKLRKFPNFRKILARSEAFLEKGTMRAAWAMSGVAKGIYIKVETAEV